MRSAGPVSKRGERRAGRWAPIAAAALAGMVVTGCSSSVSGTPGPVVEMMGIQPHRGPSSRPLAELLLAPEAFPPPYEAIVLPPQAVSQAAPDLTGIPQGAKVDPGGCLPPAQDFGPNGTAMAVGTDNANRTTISAELVAVDDELGVLEDQIRQCPVVHATYRGATSTVRTDLTDAPSVDADAALALTRTVSSGQGADAVTQSMATRIAQVGGVRVLATFMSFGTAEPDTAALDGVFTAAVQKVRAG